MFRASPPVNFQKKSLFHLGSRGIRAVSPFGHFCFLGFFYCLAIATLNEDRPEPYVMPGPPPGVKAPPLPATHTTHLQDMERPSRRWWLNY
jgi:hypothetical protein